MAHDVYGSGKQFETVNDLEDGIFEAWDKTNENIAIKFRDLMQKRCIDEL